MSMPVPPKRRIIRTEHGRLSISLSLSYYAQECTHARTHTLANNNLLKKGFPYKVYFQSQSRWVSGAALLSWTCDAMPTFNDSDIL